MVDLASVCGPVDMSYMVCFPCCNVETNQPPRRIDRSAIGAPTSFQQSNDVFSFFIKRQQHTGHLGASDSHSGVDNEFDSIKSQMKSKGGYVNRAVPTDTTHKLVGADDVKVDVPKDNAKNR
ncbi:CDC42 small effector protein 2 [Trichoplax sp. H2]|nr:CDC42 small effector protein 2 [Trichoplax sp. H2]|eukprot:RDD37354.1 CDC42 small effector protein 2 [Trichoplax sp. H2]